MNRLLYIMGFLLLHLNAFAQYDDEIKVMSRIIDGKAYIRWAPNSPIAWQMANKYGYTIEKYIVGRNNLYDTAEVKKEPALVQEIKPLPKEDFEPLMNNKYVAIMAQAIYGESFQMTESDTDVLSIINQLDEAENRFSFALLAADQDWSTAVAAGLGYIDQEIDTSLIYFYRVSVSDSLKDIHIEPGGSILNNFEQLTLPKPELELMNEGDHQVSLAWNTRYLSSFYTTYSIERSEDGKNFTSVNPSFLSLNKGDAGNIEKTTFIDSLPENNQIFHYRIKGKTPFASFGPFSNTIDAIGKDKISEVAVISKALALDGEVMIEWNFPDSIIDNIIGFKVARSNSSDGSFIEIHEKPIKDQISYIDKNPENTNYYLINTYINDSTFSSSLPVLVQLEDSIPPKPPTGLTGTIDSLGVVLIKWDKNEEKDLAGYHFYKANDLKEEWYRLSTEPFQNAFFTDTIPLNNLTREIYYSVVALDKRFNKSDYSKELKLIKIDTIPPSAPVIQNYDYLDDGILLEWSNISSNDDLYGYMIKVQNTDNEVFDTLINKSQNFIKIENNISKVLIASVDNNNNISHFNTMDLKFTNNEEEYSQAINYTLDREKNEIYLSWSTADPSSEISLYKKTKDSNWRLLKRSFSMQNYTDKNISINNIYNYKLEILHADGVFKKFDSIEVNF